MNLVKVIYRFIDVGVEALLVNLLEDAQHVYLLAVDFSSFGSRLIVESVSASLFTVLLGVTDHDLLRVFFILLNCVNLLIIDENTRFYDILLPNSISTLLRR